MYKTILGKKNKKQKTKKPKAKLPKLFKSKQATSKYDLIEAWCVIQTQNIFPR